MPGGKDKVNQRRNSKEQAEGVQHFHHPPPRSVSKGKQQLASHRNDVALFSRHYIGCQTRDGNLEEFFRHENQACPPALSDGESLRLGTKSDLLKML